jgi:hypothetical protein
MALEADHTGQIQPLIYTHEVQCSEWKDIEVRWAVKINLSFISELQ